MVALSISSHVALAAMEQLKGPPPEDAQQLPDLSDAMGRCVVAAAPSAAQTASGDPTSHGAALRPALTPEDCVMQVQLLTHLHETRYRARTLAPAVVIELVLAAYEATSGGLDPKCRCEATA